MLFIMLILQITQGVIMIKRIILATTVAATLMLSGCGSADAEGESRLAAQNAIDTGSPGEAISLLETTPISDMNTTQANAFLATLSDSTKKTLASAYMSKAGLNLTDVVSKMSSASTDTNSSDSFASLATSLAGDGNKSVEKVKNIDSAIKYYESLGSTATSASPARALSKDKKDKIDKLSKDVKLYLGMAYLSKVTLLLGMLGDVATLQSSGTLDNNFKASAKAMDCFYAGNCSGVSYDSNASYSVDMPITVEIFKVDVNSTNYYRASVRDANNSKKLIMLNYNNIHSASDFNSAKAFPFGPEYKLDQLTDAINGAFNALTSAIPDDLKSDIDGYKAKIDTNKDGTVSVTEIQTYINK